MREAGIAVTARAFKTLLLALKVKEGARTTERRTPSEAGKSKKRNCGTGRPGDTAWLTT